MSQLCITALSGHVEANFSSFLIVAKCLVETIQQGRLFEIISYMLKNPVGGDQRSFDMSIAAWPLSLPNKAGSGEHNPRSDGGRK